MRSKRFDFIKGFSILVITTVIILFNASTAISQPPPPMTCFDDSECLSGDICISGDCTVEGDIILRLSSATNAHGEIINGGGSYQFGISHSSIFGEVGSGDRTCTGDNQIVRLSSDTNAHAEGPGQNNYATEICYEGLSCVERVGGCGAGEFLVVSLSSSTNAHLSNSAGYGIDICCTIAPVSCSLTNAYWNTPSGDLEVVEGTDVELIVEGDGCNGETVSFEVWEDDPTDDLATIQPIDVTFSGTTATGTWTAEWIDDGFLQGDPEYYFKANTTSDSINSGKASADELHVTEYFIDDDGPCDSIVICSDYGNQVDCNLDGCNVADFSVGNNVNCDDPNKMCACSWIGTSSSCNATWTGFAGGAEIGECTYSQNTGDNCNDGFLTFAWTANWTWAVGNEVEQNDPENLFGECIDGSRTIECPAQIPLPFFGAYNFIVALIIIALIYVLWGSGSGKNRKKK